MNDRAAPPGVDTGALERETGFGWGWFMVLGTLVVVLGGFALLDLAAARAASVSTVGVVMLIGSIAQLGTALLVPDRKGIRLLVLSAVAYGAAAALAIFNPTLAATPLTILMAGALLCSGAARVRLTAVMPPLPGWGWVATSGLATVVAGVAVIHLSLVPAVGALGLALALDLTFQGATTFAFGLALKAGERATSRAETPP